MKWLILFVFLINKSNQLSSPEDNSYVAAVVEYNSGTFKSLTEKIQRNIDEYVKLILTPTTEKSLDFDIIVFPEATLNTIKSPSHFPDQRANQIPCNDDGIAEDFILKSISCAAKKSHRYVVINLITKQNCTAEKVKTNDPRECSPNNLNLYNTNVVFDRNGSIISTYRKYNLFDVVLVNETLKPDYGIFHTDFNVTFGHFICFDLLFKTPAIDLVLGKHKIQNIIYPTMWHSELPFLTALQIQQNWAYRLNVNFLAAGASAPTEGSTGSGIYSGRHGALKSFITSIPETRLLIATVPKIPGVVPSKDELNNNQGSLLTESNESMVNQVMTPLYITQDQIKNYKMKWIDTTVYNDQTFDLCDNQFCCHFRLRIQSSSYNISESQKYSEYSFVAAIFSGRRRHPMPSLTNRCTAGIKACAVFACTSQTDMNSCGKLFRKGTLTHNHFQFINLEISGNFPKRDIVVMPNSVTTSLIPLSPKEFTFTDKKTNADNRRLVDPFDDYRLNLFNPRSDLLTFGLYARDFANDIDSCSPSSKLCESLLIIFITLIFNYFFY